MGVPQNFAGFSIYKIYYGDAVVYVGRTMQPLRARIRGHLFKHPMHRAITIDMVTKIEYAICKSAADMYLYELYYINRYKPALNVDDKAFDNLSVVLPELEWHLFTTKLWGKWQEEIAKLEANEQAKKERNYALREEKRALTKQYRSGVITEEEYDNRTAEIDAELVEMIF